MSRPLRLVRDDHHAHLPADLTGVRPCTVCGALIVDAAKHADFHRPRGPFWLRWFR